MFHFKVSVKPSKIHGLGLFAEENISKGEKVYTINESLDLILSEKEFSNLNQNEQKTIMHYGYFEEKKRRWYLSFDDIRFCNHNKEGNLAFKGKDLIAKKDISENEELTQNYGEFEKIRAELR